MKKIIEKAILDAEENNTKLSQKALVLDGMSSRKNRIFLNSLVSNENIKYLEIGCWRGSTLLSALENNSPEYAVAIDNWSEFGGPRDEFLKNTESIKTSFEFFDQDCFTVDINKFKKKFNVYFYDGGHEEHEHKSALTYYINALDDTFIYICDDWNWEKVKKGTRSAISELNLKIKNEWELPADYNQDRNKWWNGVYVGILSK